MDSLSGSPIKRKLLMHTNWSASLLLNSLTPQQCQQILAPYIKSATADKEGNCLYASVKTNNKGYPRIQLPKTHWQYLPSEVREELKDIGLDGRARKQGSLKVALHQLQWRAMGNLVPDFSAGTDISHACKRGQVVYAEPVRSVVPASIQRGCFSSQCLQLEDHQANLNRGACNGLHICPTCTRVFVDCSHIPRCGAAIALETAFKKQKQIASISISYTDDTSTIIKVPQ